MIFYLTLLNSQELEDKTIEKAADCPNVTLDMMLRLEDNATCPYNYTIVVWDITDGTDEKNRQVLNNAALLFKLAPSGWKIM